MTRNFGASRAPLALVFVAALFFASGCTGGDEGGHDSDAAGHSHADGDGHDHDHDGHDHDHGDHDHDHDHDHGAEEDHGTEHALGKVVVGEITMDVSQYGELEGGKEIAFECTITSGSPTTIRAWVGPESGMGSMKGKGEKEDDGHFHIHVTCPLIVQVDHQLWLEVEGADGKKAKANLDLHR